MNWGTVIYGEDPRHSKYALDVLPHKIFNFLSIGASKWFNLDLLGEVTNSIYKPFSLSHLWSEGSDPMKDLGNSSNPDYM